MKKFNYYRTLAQKNWAKFLRTGNEVYLDKSIRFQESAQQSI